MESILEEAQRLIHGARRNSYGHPLDDYSRTAALWSAWLGSQLNQPLTAEQAMMLMVLMKLSRERNKHGRDNLVDAVGYLGCVELAEEERKARESKGISGGTVPVEGQAEGARCIP